MQISFTREEVFLQLEQDGGRATSPASTVCHFDFRCAFHHKEVKEETNMITLQLLCRAVLIRCILCFVAKTVAYVAGGFFGLGVVKKAETSRKLNRCQMKYIKQ